MTPARARVSIFLWRFVISFNLLRPSRNLSESMNATRLGQGSAKARRTKNLQRCLSCNSKSQPTRCRYQRHAKGMYRGNGLGAPHLPSSHDRTRILNVVCNCQGNPGMFGETPITARLYIAPRHGGCIFCAYATSGLGLRPALRRQSLRGSTSYESWNPL